MKHKYVLVLLITIATLSGFQLPVKNIISFKTALGHVIKVVNGQILYDTKSIFKIKYGDDILYESKSNRLIEDHGSIFLFIAMAGNPNLDRLNAFLITPTKATLVVDAILSPIKDYDNDGYLEFGGRDLTEMYPDRDSMYYIPTAYYEIREGKIHPDNLLTKSEDIKLNGLYLPPSRQLDKDGNCCKVVPTPGRKHKTQPVIPSHYIPDGRPFMAYDTISVFATNSVLENKVDINFVIHDINGQWFFYGDKKTNDPTSSMKKTVLATIIKIDKSILLLSIVPKGYYVERSAKSAPWGWNTLANKN